VDEATVRMALADLPIIYEARCIDTDQSMEKEALNVKAFLGSKP
jgi:hypothetical protein